MLWLCAWQSTSTARIDLSSNQKSKLQWSDNRIALLRKHSTLKRNFLFVPLGGAIGGAEKNHGESLNNPDKDDDTTVAPISAADVHIR